MLADLWHASPILPSLSVGIIILLIPSTATIHSFPPLSLFSQILSFPAPSSVAGADDELCYAMQLSAAVRDAGAGSRGSGHDSSREDFGGLELTPPLRSVGRRRLPIPPPLPAATGDSDHGRTRLDRRGRTDGAGGRRGTGEERLTTANSSGWADGRGRR